MNRKEPPGPREGSEFGYDPANAMKGMVRALFDNPDQVLRPGMEARARVLTKSRPLGYLIVRRPWRWVRLHVWW